MHYGALPSYNWANVGFFKATLFEMQFGIVVKRVPVFTFLSAAEMP